MRGVVAVGDDKPTDILVPRVSLGHLVTSCKRAPCATAAWGCMEGRGICVETRLGLLLNLKLVSLGHMVTSCKRAPWATTAWECVERREMRVETRLGATCVCGGHEVGSTSFVEIHQSGLSSRQTRKQGGGHIPACSAPLVPRTKSA